MVSSSCLVRLLLANAYGVSEGLRLADQKRSIWDPPSTTAIEESAKAATPRVVL
jgi:hypothetical protein